MLLINLLYRGKMCLSDNREEMGPRGEMKCELLQADAIAEPY
jgi:hypothetical protein